MAMLSGRTGCGLALLAGLAPLSRLPGLPCVALLAGLARLSRLSGLPGLARLTSLSLRSRLSLLWRLVCAATAKK